MISLSNYRHLNCKRLQFLCLKSMEFDLRHFAHIELNIFENFDKLLILTRKFQKNSCIDRGFCVLYEYAIHIEERCVASLFDYKYY